MKHPLTLTILLALFVSLVACTSPAPVEPGPSDVSTESKDTAEADATELSLAPLRCIGNWPTDPQATPLPSLPIDNDGQVLWTKEVPSGGGLVGPLAQAGERLAYLGGSSLHILDLEGNPILNYIDIRSQGGGGAPVADAEGNFYYGAASIFSFDPNGEPRWRFELGPNICDHCETTYTSRLLLSPEGILYFFASDGYSYALKASNGELVWKHGGGTNPHGDPWWLVVGIGDTLLTEFGAVDATTGELFEGLQADGNEYFAEFASFDHLIGYHWDHADPSRKNTYARFDRCGKAVDGWALPNEERMFVDLVGFGGSLIARYGDTARIYDSNAELVSELNPLSRANELLSQQGYHFATVLGADGTLYYSYCSSYSSPSGVMAVEAYAGNFTKLWRVDLSGYGCASWDQPPLLTDDGRLYVLRRTWEETPAEARIELTAIQTASPGLANTAYPTIRSNNRRTGWIGGPQ